MENLKNLQPPKSTTMDILLSDYSIIFLVLLFNISVNESPNPPTKNSDLSPAAKVSFQRGKAPYICSLRARIEYEPLSEYSTRSDRVTDIGCLSSWGASPLPFGKSEFYFFFVFCFAAVVAVVVVAAAASVVAEAALCSS